MSERNGERARFHRNRKRRVLQRMRLRAVLLTLKEQMSAAVTESAKSPRSGNDVPALAAS